MTGSMMLHRFSFFPLAAVCLALALPSPAAAQNLRQADDIATPQTAGAPQTEAERQAAGYGAVPRRTVEAALERLLSSWGRGDLSNLLARDFRGDTELIRNLAPVAAAGDASLRLLGLKSFRTINQTLGDHDELGEVVISEVRVNARLQVELTEPSSGEFLRSDGTNELVLRISRKLVPVPGSGG